MNNAEHAACPVNTIGFAFNNPSPDRPAFPAIETDETGGPSLYPIVDSSEWVERLAPVVSIMQLRVKNFDGEKLESEISVSVKVARNHGCMLFVNDFWKLAIKHGACGVHLGQGDLLGADIAAIHDAGLMLGVSTHCHHEAEVAAKLKPSYVAFGPVYETKLKKMPFPPQGVERLKAWRRMFDLPLVAIGGITLDNASEVLEAKPDFISVVRDITLAENPEKRIGMWQEVLTTCRAI